jgi:hypothetical protein
MWQQDDGHSAVSRKVIDQYGDNEVEVILVERQMVGG